MPLTKTELKNIQALSTKKERRARQRFTAEGIRLLEESARFTVWPETVYYAPAMLNERGNDLLRQFESARVPCTEIPSRQMKQVSDTKTPQGIIGIFRTPLLALAEQYRPRYRTILVCENISDPGNLGTLLRSALAFGFKLVVLTGSVAEPFAPKVVRASVGAVFGLALAEAGLDEIEMLIAEEKATLLAATTTGELTMTEAMIDQKGGRYALAIGSEAGGLSERLAALASVRVRIDHSPEVESLNAAMAGSILMKELYDSLQ